MNYAIIIMLTVLLACSVYANIFVVKKNLVLADQREVLVDTIEYSLDELDECYTRIAHNAEIPVLSDEPIIREVLSDIKRAKNAIIAIAGKVVIYGSENNDEDADR